MADTPERVPPRPVAIIGHPIYALLLPIPIVCFLGALAADLAYVCSENLIWLNFSGWLIFMGLLSGFLAGVFLFIDFVRVPAATAALGWGQLLLFIAAWIIEFFNMLVHNRDGWTAVAPAGLTLSVIGVVLFLIAGWLRRPALAEAVR